MKVIILLAPGFEEVEAITPIDFLRRAGLDVFTASVGTSNLEVTGAHGVTFKTDIKFEDVATNLYDAIIAPGGMPGTTNLAANAQVVAAIKSHYAAGKVVAAICAAPGFVFAEACGIMKGKTGCGYPGCDDKIEQFGGKKVTEHVHTDGNIITSRGPGTAPEFALAIIRKLLGDKEANKVGKGTLVLE